VRGYLCEDPIRLMEFQVDVTNLGHYAKETLENPSNPRENTLVIAGTDWAHGQQAARIQ
jgi:hypothetical protein